MVSNTALTLYAVDWTGAGRIEQIQVSSATTGAILDTETLSSFSGGVYLQWTLSGDVAITVTRLAGPNAVISGLFFDTKPTAQSASSAIVDTTTQGNWIGVYGTRGYNVIGSGAVSPSYAIVTSSGTSLYTWAAQSVRPSRLQTPNGSNRIAACWYGATFSIDVKFTDGQQHSLTLYAVDWTGAGRSEQIKVSSATTRAILDTETLSSFSGGVYLQWTLSGDVAITVTCLAGPNAVISGLFFDNPLTGNAAIASTVNVGAAHPAAQEQRQRTSPRRPTLSSPAGPCSTIFSRPGSVLR